jgi:methylated-DNA-protein-cysteine methyltransferase-like protein
MLALMSKQQESFERIWATIRRIPLGRVATYGQIAAEAGYPKRPRLTAQALAHVPPGMEIPWYRVINAQGRISIPEGSAGHREQKRRLKGEGVKFAGERVDLDRYRWQPRSFAPVLD